MENLSPRQQQKRASILQAAIMEFREHGFQSTSMDQVALSAKASKRTVYNYFPSKDALFDAILREMFYLIKTSILITYDPKQSLKQQLTNIAQQEVALLGSDAFLSLARITMAEAITQPDRVAAIMAEVNALDSNFVTWLKAAHSDHRMTINDIEFAAEQFITLLKSFSFWPPLLLNQPTPTKAELNNKISSVVDMFLNYYTRV
ncbi:TetR/AcrR family transcriptional regulator [Algicola sagamiensis]|uniref:TetR/AcrR family transcriptional regulator n=1 Tax=Algicola sagamiensis TaxID=163869 RepID=UPI00036284DC|nr:TetR/AcrR family transcriptional regulator [Algicola sagamiensis]